MISSTSLFGSCSKVYNMCIQIFIFWTLLLTVIDAEPQWRIKPSDQRVLIGQNATFMCEVDSSSGVGIVWQRGEKILFLNHLKHDAPENYFITGDQSSGQFNMVITNVQKADDDVYKCSVGQSTLKQPVQLTVIVPPNPPKLSLSRSGELTARETVSLTCSSEGGNPPPVISWSRNGQLITSGHTLTQPTVKFGETKSVLSLSLTRADHQAVIKCSVWNEGRKGTPLSIQTKLNVQYGPHITFRPGTSLQVLEHSSLTLRCDVNANPQVTSVQWFVGGVRQQESGFVLRITHIEAEKHSTVYECVALNKIGEGRNVTTVNVIYPPKITIPKSSNGIVYVNESSSIDLTCLVKANPKADKIEWKKSGSSFKSTGSLLSINKVNRNHAGTYTCESSNTLSPTNGLQEIGKNNESVQLIVQYAPGPARITQTPTSTVTAGQEVILTCSVDDPGFPSGQLIWTKEGNSKFRFTGSEIKFIPARLEHSGIYVCTPQNLMGQGVAARREVIVKEEAMFINPLLPSQKNVNLLQDRDIDITCIARGNPAPQISWYKDGEAISALTSDLLKVTTSESSVDMYSYRVTSVLQWRGPARSPTSGSLRHQDAGNYMCLASNGVGKDQVRSLKFVVHYAPAVSSSFTRVAVDMNQTVSLDCRAHAVPTPQFMWFHQAIALKDTQGHVKINNIKTPDGQGYRSILTLTEVKSTDLGSYVCVASNEVGNSSVDVDLTVKTVPEAPSGLVLRAHSWESALLEWSSGFNGGYPQTFVVYYTSSTQESKHVKVWSKTRFNVTGLFPSSEYTFRIYSENILGTSSYSRGISIVTDDFIVRPPSDAVYDTTQRVLTFTSPDDHFCARIFVSSDNGHWQMYEPCAPSTGGSIKISTGFTANQVNLSLCVERRQEVCSQCVLARIAAPSSGSSVVLILVGCICGLVVTVLITSLVVLCVCRRRKHDNNSKNELVDERVKCYPSNVSNSRTGPDDVKPPNAVHHSKKMCNTDQDSGHILPPQYNAVSNRPSSSYITNRPDNHNHPELGQRQNQPFLPKPQHVNNFSNSSLYRQNQPQLLNKPPGGYRNEPHHGGYGPVTNGYGSHSDLSRYNQNNHDAMMRASFELDNLRNLGLDVKVNNRKNLQCSDSPNSDMNSSGDSSGPMSSSSLQAFLKMDNGSHGNSSESGYSTPDSSKPRKVVHEVIV